MEEDCQITSDRIGKKIEVHFADETLTGTLKSIGKQVLVIETEDTKKYGYVTETSIKKAQIKYIKYSRFDRELAKKKRDQDIREVKGLTLLGFFAFIIIYSVRLFSKFF